MPIIVPEWAKSMHDQDWMGPQETSERYWGSSPF